jgi:hypothetical protein
VPIDNRWYAWIFLFINVFFFFLSRRQYTIYASMKDMRDCVLWREKKNNHCSFALRINVGVSTGNFFFSLLVSIENGRHSSMTLSKRKKFLFPFPSISVSKWIFKQVNFPLLSLFISIHFSHIFNVTLSNNMIHGKILIMVALSWVSASTMALNNTLICSLLPTLYLSTKYYYSSHSTDKITKPVPCRNCPNTFHCPSNLQSKYITF